MVWGATLGKGDTFHRIQKYASSMILAIGGGITTGYVVCPLLNYLMGTIPVPYDWITSQPEHLRFTMFLAGAFGLFIVTSLFTIGTCAAIFGFIYKSNMFLSAMLIFASSATTYCCFTLDANIFSDFKGWLGKPMAWFYISELVALLALCISMSWLGSTLGWIREYCQNNPGQHSIATQ